MTDWSTILEKLSPPAPDPPKDEREKLVQETEKALAGPSLSDVMSQHIQEKLQQESLLRRILPPKLIPDDDETEDP